MAQAHIGVPITMSPSQLMAAARAQSGVDLLDAEAAEPLSVLVDSFNREGQLHPGGADRMQARLVRQLANRLRMHRDFLAHPEIREQKIIAPIIISGMGGRTGSTKTQKLLAASGDFNWLPYWMVFNPSLRSGDRAESPQSRIEDAEEFCAWFDRMSPETKAGHLMQTHEPEEDSFVLEHSLRSPCFMGWAPLPSYLTWLLSQDMSPQFHLLRDVLQYLQWQGLADSNKRWVLKSPLYSGFEPLILDVFPDACLLMTHRSPIESVPSGLRLLECFYKPYSSAAPDPDFYVAGQIGAIDQHLRNRAALPGDAFCDIDMRALVRDPAAVIRHIYGFSKASLTDESLRRMLDWDQANPAAKYGKHVYTLEQFGLNKDRLEKDFAGYIALLRDKFGA